MNSARSFGTQILGSFEWSLPIRVSFMANWLRVPTPLVPITSQSRGTLCLPPPDKRVNKAEWKVLNCTTVIRVTARMATESFVPQILHSGSPFCSPSFETHVTGCDHCANSALQQGELLEMDCNKRQISAGERIRVACRHVRRNRTQGWTWSFYKPWIVCSL